MHVLFCFTKLFVKNGCRSDIDISKYPNLKSHAQPPACPYYAFWPMTKSFDKRVYYRTFPTKVITGKKKSTPLIKSGLSHFNIFLMVCMPVSAFLSQETI